MKRLVMTANQRTKKQSISANKKLHFYNFEVKTKKKLISLAVYLLDVLP